jgi:hypothetical protein
MEVLLSNLGLFSTIGVTGLCVIFAGICAAFLTDNEKLNIVGLFALVAGVIAVIVATVLYSNTLNAVGDEFGKEVEQSYHVEFVTAPEAKELTNVVLKEKVEGPYIVRSIDEADTYNDVYIIADSNDHSVVKLFTKTADGEYVEFGTE